ncbi:MAG: hypothetical protein ACOC1K_00080 [Nanoarchaeota archaeon]
MDINVINSADYEIDTVTENEEYNIRVKKSSNAGDKFIVPYNYSKGDETSIVISHYVEKEDMDFSVFQIEDVDGNSTKSLSADATDKLYVNTSNRDDFYRLKISVSDGSATNGSIDLGFYEVN